MLKSGGSILDANPGSDLDAIQHGTVNLTKLTTLIAAQLSPTGEPSFLAAQIRDGSANVTASDLKQKTDDLRAALQPLLANADNDIDPISGKFSADGTGHDKVLMALDVLIKPTNGKSNINVTVKTEFKVGTELPAITFVAGEKPPKLPESAATSKLPAADEDTLIANFMKRANDCYALPKATRVSDDKNVIALECRGLFPADEPKNYKDDGALVGETGAFSSLFSDAATGISFVKPEVEFRYEDGQIRLRFSIKQKNGDETFQRLRLKLYGLGYRALGNQYDNEFRVRPWTEERKFINQTDLNYYSTGFNVHVNNVQSNGVSKFTKVVVTPPGGYKPFELSPSPALDYLIIKINGWQSNTNNLRLAGRYISTPDTVEGKKESLPRDIPEGLIWVPSPSAGVGDWSDREIDQIPEMTRWKAVFYQTDGSIVTQYYETAVAPLTIPELVRSRWAQLTDAKLSEFVSTSMSSGGVYFPGGYKSYPVAWEVPTGADAPSGIQTQGTWSNTRFNDSKSVMLTDRAGIITCKNQSLSDTHCESPLYIDNIGLFFTDKRNMHFASHYWSYKIQPTIRGTVTGLASGTQLTLLNNGADSKIVAADGPFTLSTLATYNRNYSVTVSTQPIGQTCTVSSPGVEFNIINVTVTCRANTYTVGGTVSGLGSGKYVMLLNSVGNPTPIYANGAFTFSTPVTYKGSYTVTVSMQPLGQTCTVSNGSGSGAVANVDNVTVACSDITYKVGGTVSGLGSGNQVTLLNRLGNPTVISANGAFTFSTPVMYNGSYAVTVSAQPTGQICTVSSGSGTGLLANVSNVAVTCNTNTVVQIVGTAATGAALTFANVEITSTDGSSPCVETDIKTDGLGAYKCTMKVGKTAPFFIVVTDPAGNTAPLVSIATVTPTAGTPLTVNATPLTTAIVGQLSGGDALSVVSDKTKYSADKLNAIKTNVLAQIKATLTSIGAPTDYDPFTTSITAATAEQTGNTADLVLDVIKIARTAEMKLALSTIADPTPIQMATDTAQGSSVAAPPDSIGDLSKAGFLIAQKFQKCFALDVLQRVTFDSSANIQGLAAECTGLVADDASPSGVPTFLNDGFTFKKICGEYECPSMYNWLTNCYWWEVEISKTDWRKTACDLTNAKFSVPEIIAYYRSGPDQLRDIAVLNLRFIDQHGSPGNKIVEAQRFVRSSNNENFYDWYITGNQQKHNVSVQTEIRRNYDFTWDSENGYWSGIYHYISARSWAPLIETFDSVYVTGRGLPSKGLWYIRSTSGNDYNFIVAKEREIPPQQLSNLGQSCPSCRTFWMARTAGLTGVSASNLGANDTMKNWVQPDDDGAYNGLNDSMRPLKGDIHTFKFYKNGVLVDTEIRRLMSDLTPPKNLQQLSWHGDGPSTLAAFDTKNINLKGMQTFLNIDWVRNVKAEFINLVWISQIDGNFNNVTAVELGAGSVLAKPVNSTPETVARFTSLDGPINYIRGPVDGYREVGLRYRTTDGSFKVAEYWFDPDVPQSHAAEGLWIGTYPNGGTTKLAILGNGVVLGGSLTDFIVGNATVEGSTFKLLNYDFSKTKSSVALGSFIGTINSKSSISAVDTNGQTLNLVYRSVYDQPITQAEIAGNYTVTGTTLQSPIGSTPLTISPDGNFTFGLTSCTITGSITPSPNGKAVYKTIASSVGDGCDFGNTVLEGISILDKTTNSISIMTVTTNRMRGLILQGIKSN